MMTRGRRRVAIPPKSDGVIYEQPLYMLLIYYINHYLGKYQDSEIRKKSAAAWALLIINFLADLTFLINHKGIQRGDNSFSKLIGTNKGKENILPIKPPCFVSASFIFL